MSINGKSYQSFKNQTALSDPSPIYASETAHEYWFAGAKPFIQEALAKSMNANLDLYVSQEQIKKGLQLHSSKLTELELNSQNY
ncbi:hypothetical protein MJO28_006752 [Puccinia striiformis f. sp. tritici]|uniref:Uncharacterized protein n=1 Tax=Puccinia striiformis f. sp. tritici TaxID=168172 RepID=A0ACC0EIC3_9BASI|nr:hypothetical protein MJO28_006752 [Puccinia striiformis f. sp. tritici]